MKWTNRWINDHYNKTLLKYTFSNGSFIEFFSADQDDKLRGARRNILYINECNNVSLEAYNELSIRTSGEIWLDYNPTAEFWAHTEILPDKDSELLILTYLDNEGLPQTIVDDIESKKEKAKTSEYWANWWKVYGLGEVGSLQGAVFDNWETGEFNNDLTYAFGQDYGFSSDPTTLVKVAIDTKRKKIYIDEKLYAPNLKTSEIIDINREQAGNHLIIADSAEPRLITEIEEDGINIEPCRKGAGSILEGIQLLQDYKIIITPESTNIIKEFRNYVWKAKGTKPIDAYNHAIDAIRYCVTHLIEPQAQTGYIEF